MTRVHIVLDLASDGSAERMTPEAVADMCAEYVAQGRIAPSYVPPGKLYVKGHSISVVYDVQLDAYADTIEFNVGMEPAK